MSLTAKQELFCQEYLIDLNATQAAIRAGYSEDSAKEIGCENLTKPNLQERLAELMEERSRKTGITQEQVLKELARIGFSDLRNVVSWSDNGVILKEGDELHPDHAATISEVVQTVGQYGKSVKIKLYDKVSALEKMGKHLGMFTDRHEIVMPRVKITDLTGK